MLLLLTNMLFQMNLAPVGFPLLVLGWFFFTSKNPAGMIYFLAGLSAYYLYTAVPRLF